MYYGGISKADVANGEGMRLSLFVSGCTNKCKDCFNPDTWDFHYGKEWTPEAKENFLSELGKPFYDGMTVLGGEPFEPENQEAVLDLIKTARDRFPEKTIWVYTGNVYDRDLLPGGRRYTRFTDGILDSIDVLVDGPFLAEKKNIMLRFRGSENQRVIDMKETRRQGALILLRSCL